MVTNIRLNIEYSARDKCKFQTNERRKPLQRRVFVLGFLPKLLVNVYIFIYSIYFSNFWIGSALNGSAHLSELALLSPLSLLLLMPIFIKIANMSSDERTYKHIHSCVPQQLNSHAK